MCAPGDSIIVKVKIMAALSHEGVDTWKDKSIDRCIASLVEALQNGSIDMRGSCCGHGKGTGEIVLADGRNLVITKRVVNKGDE